MRRSLLCTTIAGNRVDLLTVTNFNASIAEIAERPYVAISARVHPGETNASWMMKGVMDFLLSDHPSAQER